MVTYKDVYIDKIYSIQDFDLLWQMINFQNVSESWGNIIQERESKTR